MKLSLKPSLFKWLQTVTSEPTSGSLDTALTEQVLEIPKRDRKADAQHHRQADDHRTCLEVAEW